VGAESAVDANVAVARQQWLHGRRKFKETQAVERRQWQTLAGLPGGFAKLVPSSREFLQIRTMVAELPGV
jgi:hypothetical protein